MAEWLVKLIGEKSDLEYLCTLHPSDWSVTREEDSYYMRSSCLDLTAQDESVYESATRILDLANGVARLFYPNFQLIKVDQIRRKKDDGTLTQYINSSGISSQEAVGISSIAESANKESTTHLNIAEEWLQIADQEERVARALVLYGGLEHNWRNLYIVLEVIMDDSDSWNELKRNKTIANLNTRVKNFKGTANCFGVLGAAARHAQERCKPPKTIISLSEAQSLIRDILHEWLRLKHKPTS